MLGPEAGKVLMLVGTCLLAAGLLAWTGALKWFGKLPGDIRWESGASQVYVPWVSCLLISLVLSLVMYLIRKI